MMFEYQNTNLDHIKPDLMWIHVFPVVELLLYCPEVHWSFDFLGIVFQFASGCSDGL